MKGIAGSIAEEGLVAISMPLLSVVAAGACRGQTGQPGLEGWWLLQKPQLHWLCQVSPGKVLGGRDPAGGRVTATHQSLCYPSASSTTLQFLHPHTCPCISPITLLVPPSSSHQSLHPCIEGWETRDGIAFPGWNLSLCPSQAPGRSHWAAQPDLFPRTGWEPLSKISCCCLHT